MPSNLARPSRAIYTPIQQSDSHNNDNDDSNDSDIFLPPTTMAASSPALVFFHHFWIIVVTVSCIGFTVDLCSTSGPARYMIFFVLLFWPIWLSLVAYLYGSLCVLLGHSPKFAPLARLVHVHNGIFARARTGAASLICLIFVWLIALPCVLIEFWVFLFFQMPSWWTKWMLRGMPAYVVVPYVLFMGITMTFAWGSLAGWLCARAVKAFLSVRFTLDDLASEEERERLVDYADDITVVGTDDAMSVESELKNKPVMGVSEV
jgi:hypothetical protein